MMAKEPGERLALSKSEIATVLEILARLLPRRAVWAFGSRVTGRYLKQYSDLDLAVDGQLSWPERAALSEAFDEAPLNFKVDVVELGMVDADFRERVDKDLVLVHPGEPGEGFQALRET